MHSIDLNSDLGEAFGPWTMGEDAQMLSVVTSANIACGGHAGDPETMFATLSDAAARGVIIGAHPGYEDRLGFGRRVIPMRPDEIARMVAAQIGALAGVAALAGARLRYVKPHGALANLAADDAGVVLETTLSGHEADNLSQLDFADGSLHVGRRREAPGSRLHGVHGGDFAECRALQSWPGASVAHLSGSRQHLWKRYQRR